MKKLKLLLAFCALLLGWSNASAATDITSKYLTNADLKTENSGWSYYSDAYKYGAWRTGNETLSAAVEFYAGWGSLEHTNFKFSQTVTMPAGYYRIAVNAFFREGNNGDGSNNNKAWIFAGDKTQNVVGLKPGDLNAWSSAGDDMNKAMAAFHDGAFSNEFDFKLDAETEISLGFEGKFDAIRQWCILGPVTLYEYTAEDYMGDYRAKVSEAEALYSSPMNATVLSNLKDAVVDEATLVTVDDVFDAVEALKGAISNATTSISNYEDALSILNAASSLDATGQASYAANETVAAIQSAYNDRSLESVSSDQQTTCATALRTAAKAQTTEGANMTLAITNPSFETGNLNGWTNAGMAPQGNDSFEKDGTYYAEAWQPNGTKSVKQTISAMPAGVYRLSAKSKARGVTSAKVSANGIDKAITIGDATDTYSVEFACDANADVEIGFEGVGTGAGSSWLCVDNFRLTLVSSGLPDVVAVTGKMNATVAAAQTTAIETYEANRTVANYNAASAAIAAAQASKDAYAAGKAALDKVAGILENTNVYTADAYSTFNSAYTTAAGKYEDGSWTSEEANAYVSTVFGTGWRSNATIDDFLISAWDVAPRTWDSYHVNTWSTIGDSGNPNFFAPCIEYWTGDNSTLANKLMTATISGKNPGDTYKVEAKVCVGVNTGVAASTAPTGVSLQLNDGEIISCSGTRTGETRFYEGDFEASGIIGMDGNLYVKLNVEGTNVSWVTFRNVKYTLTSAAPAATDEQKTALANAITAAEGKTLGFENGEYAPYNNVAAIEALATAKAIDPATATGYAVETATTALTGATWTANVGEKNAVYNGNFALSENDGAMAGWVTDNAAGLGGSYHARAFVLTSGGNYDNLAAFGQGDATRSCAYLRFDGTNSAQNTKYSYGTTNGYTMPLKTNTIYKLTAQAGGWGQVDKNFQIAVVNSSDENLVAQSLKTPNTGVHAGGSVINYEMYFVVPAAGNYKLVLTNTSGANNAVVISNIELKSTDALEFVDGSAVPTYAPGTYPSVKITRTLTAGKWATAVYPFAVSGVDNIAVLDSYDSEGGALAFTSAAASTANKPFFMMSNTDKSEITLSDVAVAAASVDNATASEASLIGAYTATDITKAEKNYVLSNNKIFSVGDAGATINPYRAYIQLSGAGSARALSFVVDGKITGVDNVKAASETEVKDGKYLENGKIVIVKNGKKFNANGQQVK